MSQRRKENEVIDFRRLSDEERAYWIEVDRRDELIEMSHLALAADAVRGQLERI